MIANSDGRNKEVALGRIKRLASSGLALEPFVRTALDLIDDAVPASPHRGIQVGTDHSNAYIFSTTDVEKILPAHNHYFVECSPAISGARFKINLDTLKSVLPTRTIWVQEQAFLPSMMRAGGFNEAYRPLGWHHCVGVVFHELREYLGYFGMWRSSYQKPFSVEDVDFLRASAAHITHGLKLAQLQRSAASADKDFAALPGWSAGSILLGPDARPIAMDAQARLIFQQIGVIDGVKADAFQLSQVRDALAYVAATLKDIFHDPDSGLTATAAPVARVYAHWSGIVLKLRGLRMIAADGREYTTVLVERGETIEARRRRMIARWGLSRREAEVLGYITESKTGPEIAILLGLSHDTVRKHTSGILAKLGVETRAAAMAMVRDFT
jgi:DNA-binding CsgD family transcriptional regulator